MHGRTSRSTESLEQRFTERQMSRQAPMEYQWEKADPTNPAPLETLAQDGWEVVPGIVTTFNRSIYLLLGRLNETPPPVAEQRVVEVYLPGLAPGWEKTVSNMVANTAERLNEGEDINEILRNGRTPELSLEPKRMSLILIDSEETSANVK